VNSNIYLHAPFQLLYSFHTEMETENIIKQQHWLNYVNFKTVRKPIVRVEQLLFKHVYNYECADIS